MKFEEEQDLQDENWNKLEDIEEIEDDIGVSEDQRAVLEDFIREFASFSYTSSKDWTKLQSELRRKYHISPNKGQLTSIYRELLNSNKLSKNENLEYYLIRKAIRSLSGVLVITLFTSPYPEYTDPKTGIKKLQKFSCKHNCYYCPNEPGLPRSYLSDEPGVRRGKRHLWNCIDQFYSRASTLKDIGHPVDKIEVLVLGGTWSEYPIEYQNEFILDIFYSANTFYDESPKREKYSLTKEQEINESTRVRIIGITLETRPDSINNEEIKRLRLYGCTRVQLGIQHTNNNILNYINRGCTTEDAIKAVKLLKDSCFKIDFHIMPDLPSSTIDLDKEMINYLLYNEDLQADQWKLYPCQTVPWTVIEKWYEEGKYIPYKHEDLIELMLWIKQRVHPWIRLNRVIRDIPEHYIEAGNPITNLRQLLHKILKERGQSCKCIRCREVGAGKGDVTKAILKKRYYKSSNGQEIFISYETPDEDIIFGFVRLRLPIFDNNNNGIIVFPELNGCSLIRELHVYGQMVPVGSHETIKNIAQHVGLGKKLLYEAETLSIDNGYHKIAVISGIGTRDYYKKRGYILNNTYMIKLLPYHYYKIKKFLSSYRLIIITILIALISIIIVKKW